MSFLLYKIMLFQFAPVIQAGIDSGIYEIVRTGTGELIGLARNKTTGQFVANAVGIARHIPGVAIDPLFAPAQLFMGGLQMAQTHMGFQKTYKMLDKLQNSVGVLQATTAVIGVGTVATVALSAVNLHQILKLREDVKQLRLQVSDGFIDMKQALEGQGTEIIQRIDEVAQEIEFKHHRTILAQAYGQFFQALKWLRNSLQLPDKSARNAAIINIQGMLYKALADYSNPAIYQDICTLGRLRRLECVWAIDQTITLTYQLQEAYEVVSDRLHHIEDKIIQDSFNLVTSCKNDEIDLLFPEILRIHNHDLVVIESWRNHVNWQFSLAESDMKMLQSSGSILWEENANSDVAETSTDSIPSEVLFYEKLQQKSHTLSLREQLKMMLKPELRRLHESYIIQQAKALGLNALTPTNWEDISNMTVANLYYYFKLKQEAPENI